VTDELLLPDLLRRQAEARPDVPALVSGAGAALGYREWWVRARTSAAGLVALGVAPGDRVALIGSNAAYADMGVAYVGALMAGAVVLSLSASQPRPELDDAIDRADPVLVVVCDPLLQATPAWRSVGLADLAVAAPSAPPSLPRLRPGAPAELLNTSGTTGLPRLVEADHGNLASDYDYKPRMEPEPHHFVHALTLGTNVGQVALRSSLTLGYAVVALETFDHEPYVRLAEALPMRETLLVPAMAASLVAEAADRGWTLPAVEVVAVSGAATPPAVWRGLARVFPNCRLINTYTTSEAWPARATCVVDPERIESVGRPLDDQAVEVRDDDGRRVAPFERGTIHLVHRRVSARRYVDGGAPARVHPGGWVETDDLGYLDHEGFLYVEDRKSDVVATGGHTVSTIEVERVLAEHPQVVEAAAFGLPHRVLGAYVAACVVGPAELDLDDVERVARERLAAHKVPRVLWRLDALPRTRSGKVAKRLLREDLDPSAAGASWPAARLGSSDRGRVAAAETPAERLVRSIWEQVLERDGIRLDDRFLALGGDSLSALRVVSRIQAELDMEVPVASLLAAPTITDQAAVVAVARAER
jgi:acyl-CoA synthetase (AMP-forming)/AMP-acid ligase II/acyl carrier protein